GQRRLSATVSDEGQMAIIHRADRPTDDAAGEQIQDRGQVKCTALADLELRRVTDPALIGGLGRDLPIEEVFLSWTEEGPPGVELTRAFTAPKGRYLRHGARVV